MQVQAYTKYARMSPIKVRDITRAIQGRNAAEAVEILRFIPRKSARLVSKTLKSAIANAENNNNLSSDALTIQSARLNKALPLNVSAPQPAAPRTLIKRLPAISALS